MTTALDTLKTRTTEITHLQHIGGLLGWDMQTYMPEGGAEARAQQLSLLSRLTHEQLTDEATGDALRGAEGETAQQGSLDEKCLVRTVRRDYDRATKIPATFQEEMSHHTTMSEILWRTAREQNDFAMFAPSLTKTFELKRREADYLGYTNEPYDALLDQFEPGAIATEVEALFADLQPFLTRLVQQVAARGQSGPTGMVGHFPIDEQSTLTKKVVADLGYDFTRGRQDTAAHPFCSNFCGGDVRITTRFNTERLDYALYASLHEAGHAMYEQGVAARLDGTPLGGGASMAVHESQSRLWENNVGRSAAFCTYLLPILQSAFPAQMAGITPEDLYARINRVEPTFIRVEADEVTYNLHVMLRFELERSLVSGSLKVADLPDAWNAGMQRLLGITPPTHTLGVLQDVHWSAGLVGYFPTYSLGTILSAQIWNKAQRDLGDLAGMVGRGEFAPLLNWLHENVHQYGAMYLPGDLIQKATGEPLNPAYYRDYLQSKFGA